MVKTLPNDKYPGPDGFSNEFIKKCWPIIKMDFYDLCWDFQSNNVCLQSINFSPSSLLSQKMKALLASLTRPISLLNASMKLITKPLANRLQVIITSLIHKNQHGFINIELFRIAWLGHLNICICVTTLEKNTHPEAGF